MDSMDLYNGISNGKPSMPHSATTRATAKTKKEKPNVTCLERMRTKGERESRVQEQSLTWRKDGKEGGGEGSSSDHHLFSWVWPSFTSRGAGSFLASVYDVSESVEVAAQQLQSPYPNGSEEVVPILRRMCGFTVEREGLARTCQPINGTSRSADVTHKKCQPGGVKVGRGSVKPGLLYGVLATWCASIPQVQSLLSLTLSALAIFLQTSILTIEIDLLTSIPLPMLLPLGEPDFDSNNSDELESDVDGEEHSTPIWSDSASRLLISLYSSHIELVGSENVRTMKQMWQQVAEAMRQEGYNYTNFQVENRWKTFRRSFKRKLKSGTTLGGRTVRCPFERELEPLLGDQQRKTETNNETPSGQDQQGLFPEHSDILWYGDTYNWTLHFYVTTNMVSSEEQSVEDEEEAEEPAPPTDPKYIAKGPFKRKRQCISQVLNQMKEAMATNERNKHKRHKEKMALLREKNEILQMNNALLKELLRLREVSTSPDERTLETTGQEDTI
ncbi:unnamed protein product [Timema podura]|uniref:Myb/SANT-like DNA-binding domain-containing protein n=1 Tax=Timema podura TaxID=61482 RepID=A0ABN7P102_TIMPD|nr:unnamed protein product [Timema podura]